MYSEPIGTLPCGSIVHRHTLTNPTGAELQFITYGGIVTSLRMPDRNGVFADLVLGFSGLAPYLAGHPYFGAITGRVAGRIPGGRFTLDGTAYQLDRNDGGNHLHGGLTGLDKRLWSATPVTRPDGADSLALHYLSPDGEEGYPGNLDLTVTYTLTAANEFIIETVARTDRTTPVSLTHHSYFNLLGEGSGGILDHELEVNADTFIAMDDTYTPTADLLPVDGRPADLRQPRRLRDVIPGFHLGHGNLYLLGSEPCASPRRVARLCDPASGRTLTVHTTEHCLQIYTSSAFDGSITGKSGRTYQAHEAICLECEGYPDGVNHPEFGDILVRPGQPRRHLTVYAFGTD